MPLNAFRPAGWSYLLSTHSDFFQCRDRLFASHDYVWAKKSKPVPRAIELHCGGTRSALPSSSRPQSDAPCRQQRTRALLYNVYFMACVPKRIAIFITKVALVQCNTSASRQVRIVHDCYSSQLLKFDRYRLA